MKDRFAYAFAARLSFMVIAGIIAVVIIQLQSLAGIPSKIRRAFN